VGETREGRVSAEGEMQSKLDELISEMIDRGITLREAMSEFEKRFILKVLERNGKRNSLKSLLCNCLRKKDNSYFQ